MFNYVYNGVSFFFFLLYFFGPIIYTISWLAYFDYSLQDVFAAQGIRHEFRDILLIWANSGLCLFFFFTCIGFSISCIRKGPAVCERGFWIRDILLLAPVCPHFNAAGTVSILGIFANDIRKVNLFSQCIPSFGKKKLENTFKQQRLVLHN